MWIPGIPFRLWWVRWLRLECKVWWVLWLLGGCTVWIFLVALCLIYPLPTNNLLYAYDPPSLSTSLVVISSAGASIRPSLVAIMSRMYFADRVRLFFGWVTLIVTDLYSTS